MQLDWGEGSYERTGEALMPVAERVVEGAGIVAGETVLDVGCGTGNGAIAAARRGARVTGIDPAARLLDTARARAAAESLDIAFFAGDAARTGVEEGSFDVAIAVFSVIFAPDPGAAVAGMVRALKPGGRLVLTSWIPEGPVPQASLLVRREMGLLGGPPPPWASETGMRELLTAHGLQPRIVEASVPLQGESPEAWWATLEAEHPFWRLAISHFAAEPERWAAIRGQALELLRQGNEVSTGFRATSRYWIVRAEVPGEAP